MKCFINGKRTDITYTAVNMPPYNGLSEVGCCIFTLKGETEICIEIDEKVISAAVRPLALNTEFYTYGNSVVLKFKESRNISVEINNDPRTAFFVFGNPQAEVSTDGFDNIIRYNRGEHIIDELLIDRDNTIVIIEDGAVVNGRIISKNASNIKICGTGIITMKEYTRGLPEDMTRCIEFRGCNNVILENICVLDACNWSVRLDGCDRWTVVTDARSAI